MDNIIIAFATFGTVILTILKLIGVIEWSWWYVTSPASITFLIVLFFTVIKAFNEATSTEKQIDRYILKNEKRNKKHENRNNK